MGRLNAMPTGADHDAGSVDIGVFQADDTWTLPYDYTVTTGFKPSYIEVRVEEHYTHLNTVKNSTSSPYVNHQGWATPDKQITSHNSPGSRNSDAHSSYVGTGQVIYAIQTDATGEGNNGVLQANVKSFNRDGFTLEFTEVPTSDFYVIYKAFR